MAHDAHKTWAYITQARILFKAKTPPWQHDHFAYAYLRGMRTHGDCDEVRRLGIGHMVPNVKGAEHDESLADAEHYSYARYLASVTGDPAAHALVSGYELKKRLSPGSVQRANKNYPVLAPSKESEAWGHRGVDDGLDEIIKRIFVTSGIG